jgi:hypothetical protein
MVQVQLLSIVSEYPVYAYFIQGFFFCSEKEIKCEHTIKRGWSIGFRFIAPLLIPLIFRVGFR